MPAQIEFYGIRHHGPGSARSVMLALNAYRPDLILVEGPPDADDILHFCTHPEIQPPVALLLFNPKNLKQAAFYPYSVFSPEWQTFLFAFQHKTPVRHFDLPQSIWFGLKESDGLEPALFEAEKTEFFEKDPFAFLAELAGYTDQERWWEAVLERSANGNEHIFPAIIDLMTALRQAPEKPESRETLLREAHMRQQIRAAVKEGFQKIAVVCGAWHLPGLCNWQSVPASKDASALKGLKKVKTEATWIPWTADRLTLESGYGAGVNAPAWYQLLFEAHLKNDAAAAITDWMAAAARLLREEDFSAATSDIIDAVRLADALAIMRHTAIPGIEELKEAALTVLCKGAEKQLEVITKRLVVGEAMGTVPSAVPRPPLKSDFEAEVKSCRLELAARVIPLSLDLREPAGLRKSKLLHRVLMLGINWGKELEIEGKKHGRFHENWQLQWLPDYEIKLIEAGTWGNTIESAATAMAIEKAQKATALAELVSLFSAGVKADLPLAIAASLHHLQAAAALANDTLSMLDATLPLAETLRYGHARQIDMSAIESLLENIIPRVTVQMPGICTGIDEESAEKLAQMLLRFNHALALIQKPDYEALWIQSLEIAATNGHTAPHIAGLATRLLFDKNSATPEQTGQQIQLQLSRPDISFTGALWIEGFLSGSGLLLIHHPILWQVIDDWVSHLPEPAFMEMLPVLRRAFARFDQPEREKMLDMAKGDTAAVFSGENTTDAARADRVNPLLDLIFPN